MAKKRKRINALSPLGKKVPVRCLDGGIQPNAHVPTLQTKSKVEALVAAGFTHEQIASNLNINNKTLTKHYKNELDNTMANRTIKLTESVYRDALKGDKQSRELWLRCRARWANAKSKEDREREEKTVSLLEQLVKNTGSST